MMDDQIKDALCNNDIRFFENNLGKKFDINYRFQDEDNETLLHFALGDKNSEIYKYLLSLSPDFSVKNDFGETLLHSIVYSGEKTRIAALREKINIEVNKQAIDGTTPLLLSILLNKKDIFSELLSLGADVNISDFEGVSPLHIACQDGLFDIVQILVNNNANIKVKTTKGNYPLSLAVNGEHTDVIKYLFNKLYNV